MLGQSPSSLRSILSAAPSFPSHRLTLPYHPQTHLMVVREPHACMRAGKSVLAFLPSAQTSVCGAGPSKPVSHWFNPALYFNLPISASFVVSGCPALFLCHQKVILNLAALLLSPLQLYPGFFSFFLVEFLFFRCPANTSTSVRPIEPHTRSTHTATCLHIHTHAHTHAYSLGPS